MLITDLINNRATFITYHSGHSIHDLTLFHDADKLWLTPTIRHDTLSHERMVGYDIRPALVTMKGMAEYTYNDMVADWDVDN